MLLLSADCGPLATLINGQVREEGLEAIYTCNLGYSLVGDSIRSCLSNKTWSSSAPICMRILQNLDAIIGSVVAVVTVIYIIVGVIILLALILCCVFHKLKKGVHSLPARDIETIELRGER